MKPAVVFIHGFGKSSTTWNLTEFNKNINIEKLIAAKARTLLVQIDDYQADPAITVIPIVEKMKAENNKWTIVCHSIGVIYGLELLNHGLTISGFCLIDPSTPTESFVQEEIEDGYINIGTYCRSNFLEKKLQIEPKIVFHVHLDYDPTDLDDFADGVEFYKQFVGKNDKSKIIIHPGKGHMIHYTDGPKIVNSILSLLQNK